MDNLTAGNPVAHRVRVYFEGSTAIYEGMPLCYNYDTTDNWFGGSVSDGAVSATGTTAEGSQNEGKYIRVERPATGNLIHLAGFVAKGGWVGKNGPRALDVYVPNGAIVPVRCDVDTTTGATILFMQEGEEELGYSNGGSTSRPVAIAMETETGLDGTAGITLAKIDPSLFLYQTLDGTAMDIGSGTEYGHLKFTTSTTSLCWGPQIHMTNTGTGAGGMIALRVEAHGAGTAIAGNVYGIWSQAELDASAVLGDNKEIAGVWAKAYIPSTCTTCSGDVYGAKISLGLNKAISGDVAFIMFDATTTVAKVPDYLFECLNEGNTVYQPNTTHAEDAKVGAIKIYIGSGAKYLWVYDGVA